ncbi:MAG TPA: TolC family protein [Tepidisphaeraceae bacterium]|nr:TolC family protein [Tepidisphaeraceae bacterium]
MRRCVVSLLALAWLMGGCAVDQEKEVATYRRVIDIPATQPAQDFQPGEPVTVRRAMLLANALNEQLSIEGEDYLQALIDRRRAVAAFLPTVGLSPRYTIRDRTSGGGGADNDNDLGTGGGSSQRETFDVPVTGAINVFNGFSDLARLRSSRLTIEQRRALLLDVQEQLLLDVARVFYQVLRSEESVRVLENSLAVQDARLRDVRGRREAGVVRPLDVAQIEAQASQTRVSLIAARADVVNGRATLAFITNAAVATSPLVEAFEVPPIALPASALRAIAEERRRDLAAAVAAARAARQEVEVAWGQYYPSVALDLSVFLYRESSPQSRDWDALIRANLPIFSAGLIHADVRTAWSLFRQAVLNESLTRRQVAKDVAIAHEDLLSSGRRLDESRTQLAAAEQAFVQADRSNAIGLATNLERLIAQDQLLAAQLQYVSEQFARKVSYLNLLRATGSLRSALEEMATTTRPATQPAALPLSGL